jgi:hypothetical protein
MKKRIVSGVLALVGVLAGCAADAPDEDVVVAPQESRIAPQACTTQCIYNCWQRYYWAANALHGCQTECCGGDGANDGPLHPTP